MIDPETKKYIDAMMTEHVIKVSALISTISNHLEAKGILQHGEFTEIMSESHSMAKTALDAANVFGPSTFAAMAKDSAEFKEVLDKIMERKWDDLK